MTPPELFSRLFALEMSSNCFRMLFWFMAGNSTLRGSPFPDSSARVAVATLKKMGLVGGDVDAYTVLLPGLPKPGPIDPPQQITAQVPAQPQPAPQAALQAPVANPQYAQPRFVFQNPKALRFMQRVVQHQEHALNAWTVTGANLDECEVARSAAQALLAGHAPPPDCEPALAMAEDFAQVLFPA